MMIVVMGQCKVTRFLVWKTGTSVSSAVHTSTKYLKIRFQKWNKGEIFTFCLFLSWQVQFCRKTLESICQMVDYDVFYALESQPKSNYIWLLTQGSVLLMVGTIVWPQRCKVGWQPIKFTRDYSPTVSKLYNFEQATTFAILKSIHM